MASASHRLSNRIPDTDWAEVHSPVDSHLLAVGHLKDVGDGGLSIELPICLTPGTQVRLKLSTITSDVLHHSVVSGTVMHTETSGEGCTHGIKFTPLTRVEAVALTDYLCQVDYHHRGTP